MARRIHYPAGHLHTDQYITRGFIRKTSMLANVTGQLLVSDPGIYSMFCSIWTCFCCIFFRLFFSRIYVIKLHYEFLVEIHDSFIYFFTGTGTTVCWDSCQVCNLERCGYNQPVLNQNKTQYSTNHVYHIWDVLQAVSTVAYMQRCLQWEYGHHL